MSKDLKNQEYLPSYGRKRARGISAKLEAAYNRLPEFQITLQAAQKLDKTQKIILEIGFGNGEHLAHLAKINLPETLVIGSEVYLNGVANALSQLQEQASVNTKVFDADCRELLEQMPSESIDKIYILFPDPWPKERHHKRRIINEFMLKLMSQKLKKAGEVRFGSDIEEYFSSALLQFQQSPFFEQISNTIEEYKIPTDHIETKYQRKAKAVGRIPNFFEFKKV